MKWNLRSKRFLVVLLVMVIWCGVGFVAKNWEVFKYMVIPSMSFFGGYVLGETWRPSGSGE